MAVAYGDRYITGDRLLVIDAAAVEVGDIGIVNEPVHIAVYKFLPRTGQLAEQSSAYVALGVLGICRGTWLEVTGQIELFIFASCNGDGNPVCLGVLLVNMTAVVEHLEPDISAYMEVERVLNRTFGTVG